MLAALTAMAPGCRKDVTIRDNVVVHDFILSVPSPAQSVGLASNSWGSAPGLPAPRAFAAALEVDGITYVVGGEGSDNEPTTTVFALDPATAQWGARIALPQPRAQLAGVAANDGDLHVFGGRDGSGTYQASAFRLRARAGRWESAAPMPVAGGCGAAATVGARIYIFIGCDASGRPIARMLEYDPVANRYFELAEPSHGHTDGALVVARGQLLLVGGTDHGAATRALERYDSTTKGWQPAGLLPTAQVGRAAVFLQQSLVVLGGADSSGSSHQVMYLDPATGRWFPRADLPDARAGAVAVAVPATGHIFVIGGRDLAGRASVRVDRFAHGDYWLRAPGLPSARDAAVAVQLNGIIYVIGGFLARSGLVSTNEGFRTASGRWDTYADLPAPRGHAMAAAANGRIYVFGGNADAATKVATNTTFAYDPASNSWSTRAPMPVATNGGAAVTIDSLIYVSTGDGSRDVFAYDPATDRWRTLPRAPGETRAAAGAAIDHEMYLTGGNGFWKFAKAAVSVYDTRAGGWSRGVPLPHAVRFAAASGAGDGIRVFGGIAGLMTSTAYTQHFDAATRVWSVATPMPATAYSSTAVSSDGVFYVLGGKNAADRVTSAVWAYIP